MVLHNRQSSRELISQSKLDFAFIQTFTKYLQSVCVQSAMRLEAKMLFLKFCIHVNVGVHVRSVILPRRA